MSLINKEQFSPVLKKFLMDIEEGFPFEVTITATVRTVEEQQALYAQGRTKPGSIVTKADGVKNKSNHQIQKSGFGEAVDIVPAKEMWDAPIKTFNIMAGYIMMKAKELGVSIEWGGAWKSFQDLPHFQLKK